MNWRLCALRLRVQILDWRLSEVGVQMPDALPPPSATGKDLVRRWIEQGATAR